MIQIDRQYIPKDPFYVAVSGGVDSIAAADLLHRFNPGIGIFHYNHRLREQNDEMERSVIKFATDRDLPIYFVRRPDDVGVTEQALHKERQAAYQSLETDIVLCHHLDDAVESYIMRTIQGNPEYVPIPRVTEFPNGKCIFRPFIRTRKADFEEYAKHNDLLQYVVQDETNQDPTYCRRNHIRHNVLPMFDGMGLPKVVLKKFYTL
jgi:tRNA(Ile)-lysidine synthetase-like protein